MAFCFFIQERTGSVRQKQAVSYYFGSPVRATRKSTLLGGDVRARGVWGDPGAMHRTLRVTKRRPPWGGLL